MPATDLSATGQTVIKRAGAITGIANNHRLTGPRRNAVQGSVRALLKRLGFRLS
jgi:hypothetical protein